MNAPSKATDTTSTGSRWISVFGALLLAHMVNHLYLNLMPVLFPEIMDELTLSYQQIGILATSFTFAMGFGQFFVGFLSELFSRRTMLVAGLALSAFMILLTGLASGFETLVLWQLLAGLGASTYHPAGTAAVSGIFNKSRRGRVMGIHDTAGNVGTIVAPLAAVSVMAILGWRSTLMVFALPGLLAAVLLSLVTKTESRKTRRTRRDLEKPIRQEMLLLFADSRFVALIVINAAIVFRFRGLMAFLPSYLVRGLEIDISSVGLYLSIMFVGFLFGPYSFGYLRDKAGGRLALLVLILPPSILLVTLVSQSGLSILIVNLVLLGFFVYSSGPVITAVAADLLDDRSTDVMFGLLFAIGFSVSATASIVAGFLIDYWGFTASFYMLSLVPVVAAPLVMFLPRRC